MNARKDHTSLQTGNYKTLLVDDTARHYAYLRNLPGEDVSVILVNRGVDAQINLNLAGLVPVGANFQKLLTTENYTVNAEGSINNISVAANSVAILLLADSTLAAPSGNNSRSGSRNRWHHRQFELERERWRRRIFGLPFLSARRRL